MRLAELQQQFQQRVLVRQGLIEPELMGAAAPDFEARLGAYVEGYRSRLIEALGATYPALKATLGEEYFGQCMRDYIESTPSRHYSVRYYGALVSERMAAAGDDRARMLADLARWEWLLAEVFDAPDDEALGVEALAEVPPDAWAGVSFQFRACVRQIDLNSNAVEYWRASKTYAPCPRASRPARLPTGCCGAAASRRCFGPWIRLRRSPLRPRAQVRASARYARPSSRASRRRRLRCGPLPCCVVGCQKS